MDRESRYNRATGKGGLKGVKHEGKAPSANDTKGAVHHTDEGAKGGHDATLGVIASRHLKEHEDMHKRHMEDHGNTHDKHHAELAEMHKRHAADGKSHDEHAKERRKMHEKHHHERHTKHGEHAKDKIEMANRQADEIAAQAGEEGGMGGNPQPAPGQAQAPVMPPQQGM